MEGLSNGVKYQVRAIAQDEAGNESDPSDTKEETPIFTEGYFGGLVRSGSEETGGCAASGGAATASGVFIALGIWALSMRRGT